MLFDADHRWRLRQKARKMVKRLFAGRTQRELLLVQRSKPRAPFGDTVLESLSMGPCNKGSGGAIDGATALSHPAIAELHRAMDAGEIDGAGR